MFKVKILICFILRFNKLMDSNKKFQKKRCYSKYIKNIYSTNSSYLISKKNMFLELYNFNQFKRNLKFLTNKNNLNQNFLFIWICLRNNFPISKKSKNSRMGKGKGAFLRWVVKVPSNLIILKFKTLNKKILKYKLNRLLKFNGNLFMFKHK